MKVNKGKSERKLLNQLKKGKRWCKVVGALACLVVFCTVYALILPAVTMDKTTDDRQEETSQEASGAVSEEGIMTLQAEGEDYQVTVTCDEGAGIPEGAILEVTEYAEDSDEYKACFEKANSALIYADGSCVHKARFFDISIMDGDVKIEPQNAVNVKISQNSDITENTENLLVTHETDTGTDVISEVELIQEKNGYVTASFETESFSDYGTISAGQSVTMGIGDTVTLTGSSGNRNNWSVSPDGYVTIKTSGTNAVITGTVAGTVMITHQYKNNKSETFTVIITDTGGAGDSDEEALEKESAQQGYTVTVKGNKKILKDAELFVEEIQATDNIDYYSKMVSDIDSNLSTSVEDQDSVFDFLKMYHIYLSKDGGKTEYDPTADETLNNVNINLQVTITYDTAPEGWPSANGNLYVGHYKKNGDAIENKGFTDVNGIKQIKVSGNSVTFHIKSFSVLTLTSLTKETDTSVNIQPGSDGTYGENLAQTAANSWQIASGGYVGNAQSNKKESGDFLVRVQKNVVPTDTENEFLIYLSIDKKVSWEEIIQNSNLLITSSGSYKKVGEIYESIHGNSSEISPVRSGTAGNEYTATVTLTRNGTAIATFTQKYYGSTPNCSNATGFLKLVINGKTKYVTASTSVNLHEDGSGSGGALTYTVPLESLESKFDFADFTVGYDGVSDVMGGYIDFDSSFTAVGNYSTAPTYDSSTKTLSWIPVQKDGLSPVYTDDTTKVTGWYLNSAELVYKVRLDVTKTDFQSAAEYLTTDQNKDYKYPTSVSASLSYHWTGEEADRRTTDFASPEVRGLLYDVEFSKVDSNDNNKLLEGAEFKIKDSEGKESLIGEGTSGKFGVGGLAYGTYIIEETKFPEGYQATEDDVGPWTVSVCYTTNTTNICQSSSNPQNMLFTGNSNTENVWKIENKKKDIYVDIIKTDMSYQALSGAIFSIYDTDPSKSGAVPLEDYENVSVTSEGMIVDNMELEDGKTYYLVETRAPDGYYLPTSNVVLKVDMSNTVSPISVSGGAGTIGKEEETQEIDGTESTVYVIKIPNNPGVELPATGGTGTLPYTLGGAGLVLASVLMYGYSMRRKRERRSR